MPPRPLSNKRYQLRSGALAWLVELNPTWNNFDGSPCIERIARYCGINPTTLLRISRRSMELNVRVMAALVAGSGAPRDVAEKALFEIVGEEVQQPGPIDGARELVEAA